MLNLLGQAPADTVITFSPVEVFEPKSRDFPTGTRKVRWTRSDPLRTAATSLADLIASSGEAFIKSYGLGSLATISLRGGSASQTLLLWQGLPISSPMLGLLDFSLIPAAMFDQVAVQKGGNSAAFGSGAIAGSFSLRNNPQFGRHLSIASQSQLGSFNARIQNLQVKLGNDHFHSSTRLNYEEARNDFRFRPSSQADLVRQTNNKLQKKNLLQDFHWRINAQNQFSVNYWYQVVSRQIPPTLTQVKSMAQQDDTAHRLSLAWIQTRQTSVWRTQIGILDETQIYRDEAIGLTSQNAYRNLLFEIQGQWVLSRNQSILVGSTGNYTEATADAYQGPSDELRTSLFGTYRWESKKLILNGSLRQEVVDGAFIPLIPNLGLEWNINKGMRLKTNISRNYRLPTLNDRFWRPGGNPQLQPEQGWSQELGLEIEVDKSKHLLKFSMSGFNRIINQWILWRPETNRGFWAPENIGKVWSRGLETRLSLDRQIGEVKIQLKIGQDLIYSTNEVHLPNLNIEKGNQLIYTPRHQLFAMSTFSWRQLLLYYRHSFIGKSQGINAFIDAYDLGTVGLQYRNKKEKVPLSVFLQINNLWDRTYVVIERRPMPGTHWNLGLRIDWRRETNSKIKKI